jgi:hypothetical protein
MNRIAVAQEILKIAKELMAMEFPTDAAMKKYLREHPDADKSLHRVVKTDHGTISNYGTHAESLSHAVHYGLGSTPSHFRDKVEHEKETLSHLTPEHRKGVKSALVKKMDGIERDTKALVSKYQKKNSAVWDAKSLKSHLKGSTGDEENEDAGRVDAMEEQWNRYQSLSDALSRQH